MPGPNWRREVQSLDSNLDRCRAQIDQMTATRPRDGDADETLYRGQVFQNSSTVVEVAVKTHKKHKKQGRKAGMGRMLGNKVFLTDFSEKVFPFQVVSIFGICLIADSSQHLQGPI